MIQLLSRIISLIPLWIQRPFCYVTGSLFYYLMIPRRKIIMRNLLTVFPEKSVQWRKRLAKLNCQRWVETVLLSLSSSHWTKEKIYRRIQLSPELRTWLDQISHKPSPCIVLIPHLNLMETATWIPAFLPYLLNVGIIYRPFNSPKLERWIKQTRERFGVQLISRKRGIAPLEKILNDKGMVGLLFDQSAGEAGILTSFFGRLASSTDLHGRLAEKYNADVVSIYLRRTGFMRGECCLEKIPCKKISLEVTFSANQWLEKKLKQDDYFYENWLWMHRRWKTQECASRHFCIHQKRDCLPETLQFYKYKQLPRQTNAWIRLPNRLKDCVMAYPVIKAIREARPDFFIHLVVQKPMAQWIQKHFPADHIHVLPKGKGFKYFKTFLRLRDKYPDLWINLDQSLRSDLESFCSGAFQRFGLATKHPRLFLTHTWKPEDCNCNQTELWYNFFKHFGLKKGLNRQALQAEHAQWSQETFTFGCFCGADEAAKRWPIDYWQKFLQGLLRSYPQAQCILFGTQKDNKMCSRIAAALPPSVRNLSGQRNLVQLETELLNTHFIVSTDTDGLYMANMLGIPSVGLYGKTASKPFFETTHCVLQGAKINSIDPRMVYDTVINSIKQKFM